MAALFCALPAGCSDGGANGEADASENSDGAITDAGPGTVVGTFILTDPETGEPMEGFEICPFDDSGAPCRTTDPAGIAVFDELPADSELAFKITRAGYWPVLRVLLTSSEDMTVTEEYGYLPNDTLQTIASAAGVSVDDSTGTVACAVVGGGESVIPGLSPAGGNPTAYFARDALDPSPTAVADLFLFDVSPGQYEVTFEHPERECKKDAEMWSGEEPNRGRVRVEAGYLTWGCAADCSGIDTRFDTSGEPYLSSTECAEKEPAAMAEATGTAVPADHPCAECVCNACLAEINNCREAVGCLDVVHCGFRVRCGGIGCYSPSTCMSVIDAVPGGPAGAAVSAAMGYDDCSVANCEADCAELREKAGARGRRSIPAVP
jgi:hypothetical protein